MSAKQNTGGPAFPLPHAITDRGMQVFPPPQLRGLTVRDYFAAKAMQGMLGGRWPDANEITETASRAYAMADAMLAERSKP